MQGRDGIPLNGKQRWVSCAYVVVAYTFMLARPQVWVTIATKLNWDIVQLNKPASK